MGWYPCGACESFNECILCTDDEVSNIDVTYAGFLNDSCGSCTGLNATHEIDTSSISSGKSQCFISTSGFSCTTDISFAVVDTGADYRISSSVNISVGASFQFLEYEKNMGSSKPDCTSFSSEILSQTLNIGSGTQCTSSAGDLTDITCTVSSA